MGRFFAPGVAGLLFAACAGNPAPPSPPAVTGPAPVAGGAAGLEGAVATITREDMYARIAYLASDELGGRDTPSPGLEMAAAWIAREFGEFGLSPGGDDATFLQRWSWNRSAFDPESTSLEVRTGGVTVKPAFGGDFFVVPAAGRTSAAGALLWAGSVGAAQPLGPDAAGKFVAYFVPGAQLDAEWNQHVQTAVVGAMSAGAAGAAIIMDPGLGAGMIGQIASQTAAAQAPMFVIGLSYASAGEIFAKAGQNLDALRQNGTGPVELAGSSVAIRIARRTEQHRPPNVVGLLLGSDPVLRNEYVVFSAHMDHVGIGRPDAQGDSIYNGADDDASGTATMIEVAQAFAGLRPRPKRSLIFLAVSGEEKGLLGSDWFVRHPPVPIDRIVANINLDMVGRNAPDTIVAIGQDYSSLGPTIQAVASRHPELGLVVAPDLWPQEQLFLRSDHYSFAKNGVPAIFFTTGLHDQYHQPSDHVDLIDTDKIARVGRLVFLFANEVANATAPPKWTEQGIAEVKPARR